MPTIFYFPCLLLLLGAFTQAQQTGGEAVPWTLLSQGSSLEGTPAAPPNIVFILTDDQRYDAIGYAGNDLVTTPEMDELARKGTYFNHALVTTPICAASRASILTGLRERTHRFDFTSGNVADEYMHNAYPKVLKEAGYQTAFYGKLGVEYDHPDSLFDVYESYDRLHQYPDRRGYYYKTIGEDTVHLTRYTGQQAMDYIKGVDTEKPFCLSLSFSAPHAHDSAPEQYFWERESDTLLAGTQVPEAALGGDDYFASQPEDVRTGFNRLRWTWRYDTPEKYQHSVKGYYRMIADIDREIGKLRAELERKGLAGNTVIIVMGDNGYFLGERQLAGKWLMYDNSIRVPLIIYDPREPNHRDVDQLVLNIDVPATILELAGADIPPTYQGRGLKSVINHGADLQRDTILIEHLWEFAPIPPSEGVRTSAWKYFRYINDKSLEELYYLTDDPAETKNLAHDPTHRETLLDLRQKCDELIEQSSDAHSAPPTQLSQTGDRSLSPTYHWALPAAAGPQSAYQLLVASSREKIDQHIGDVWNSAKVASAETSSAHRSAPLRPATTYYWRVRSWDAGNRPGRYSAPQSFTTAPE